MCCQHKIYDIIKEKFEHFTEWDLGNKKGGFMSFTIQDMIADSRNKI